MQLCVYISDTTVTLKQSQGHQTYNEDVNAKQGYNHAKFEKFCFHGVQEKDNDTVFSNKEVCQTSPLNRHKTQK